MDAAEDTRLLCQKQRTLWEFPGGPVVRILGFYCHGLSLIPRQGTEILQASWCSQKKKKKGFPSHNTVNSVNLAFMSALPAPQALQGQCKVAWMGGTWATGLCHS